MTTTARKEIDAILRDIRQKKARHIARIEHHRDCVADMDTRESMVLAQTTEET